MSIKYIRRASRGRTQKAIARGWNSYGQRLGFERKSFLIHTREAESQGKSLGDSGLIHCNQKLLGSSNLIALWCHITKKFKRGQFQHWLIGQACHSKSFPTIPGGFLDGNSLASFYSSNCHVFKSVSERNPKSHVFRLVCVMFGFSCSLDTA